MNNGTESKLADHALLLARLHTAMQVNRGAREAVKATPSSKESLPSMKWDELQVLKEGELKVNNLSLSTRYFALLTCSSFALSLGGRTRTELRTALSFVT